MNRYLPLAAALCALVLSGCTAADWDRAMTYSSAGEEPAATVAAAAPPAAMPVAAAAPDTDFCQAVAKQDAGGNGFDAATQQRMFQRSFQQCMSLFASDVPLRGALAAN